MRAKSQSKSSVRNLETQNAYATIVINTLPRVLDVLIVTGSRRGDRVYMPRVALAPKFSDLPFTLKRRQFPLKPAWAITINKAQGQTLARVGVYLPDPVFFHGQLYVAISRVGSSQTIKVLVLPSGTQGWYTGDVRVPDGVYTDNVVWIEARCNVLYLIVFLFLCCM